MTSFNLLGVKINDVTESEVLDYICKTVESGRKAQISTVNNEFILEAQKNKKFLDVLNKSDLNIADSSGVVWAIKNKFKRNIKKIPGADLFEKICALSNAQQFKIFLLGGGKNVAAAAKDNLEKKFPNIKIVGAIDSIQIDSEKENASLNQQIDKVRPNIIFVALGAPKQELWISNNLEKINANIFMGVGGTLDFASGKIKRAPSWMRRTSLEWLYRLFRQPKRLGRILNALIIFPYLVLTSKN